VTPEIARILQEVAVANIGLATTGGKGKNCWAIAGLLTNNSKDMREKEIKKVKMTIVFSLKFNVIFFYVLVYFAICKIF
jgi:hypothetical protein